MKVLIKIKEAMNSKVKNGGMHFLNSYVAIGKEVEVEVEKADLECKQFTHWFDLVEQEEVKEKPIRRLRKSKAFED